jgi:hypothetical protein
MNLAQPEPVVPLVEHFCCREAGRLVAVLTRFLGWRNFDLVEGRKGRKDMHRHTSSFPMGGSSLHS